MIEKIMHAVPVVLLLSLRSLIIVPSAAMDLPEKVLVQNPDLVIMPTSQGASAEEAAKKLKNMPVIAFSLVDKDRVIPDAEIMGEILGKESQAMVAEGCGRNVASDLGLNNTTTSAEVGAEWVLVKNPDNNIPGLSWNDPCRSGPHSRGHKGQPDKEDTGEGKRGVRELYSRKEQPGLCSEQGLDRRPGLVLPRNEDRRDLGLSNSRLMVPGGMKWTRI
jgi:hypothetical protein